MPNQPADVEIETMEDDDDILHEKEDNSDNNASQPDEALPEKPAPKSKPKSDTKRKRSNNAGQEDHVVFIEDPAKRQATIRSAINSTRMKSKHLFERTGASFGFMIVSPTGAVNVCCTSDVKGLFFGNELKKTLVKDRNEGDELTLCRFEMKRQDLKDEFDNRPFPYQTSIERAIRNIMPTITANTMAHQQSFQQDEEEEEEEEEAMQRSSNPKPRPKHRSKSQPQSKPRPKQKQIPSSDSESDMEFEEEDYFSGSDSFVAASEEDEDEDEETDDEENGYESPPRFSQKRRKSMASTPASKQKRRKREQKSRPTMAHDSDDEKQEENNIDVAPPKKARKPQPPPQRKAQASPRKSAPKKPSKMMMLQKKMNGGIKKSVPHPKPSTPSAPPTPPTGGVKKPMRSRVSTPTEKDNSMQAIFDL